VFAYVTDFSEFFAVSGCYALNAHLEWIFAEITGDRPKQPAYEIKLILVARLFARW